MVLEMAMQILKEYDEKAHNARYTIVAFNILYSLFSINAYIHFRNHQPVCQACYQLIKNYLLGQSR